MTQRAEYACFGHGGNPATLRVFDDGLVLLAGSRIVGADAGLLGAVAGQALARRRLRKQTEVADPLPTGGHGRDLVGVRGALYQPFSEISEIRLEKGLASGRKLKVIGADGRATVWRLSARKVDVAAMGALLTELTQGRFTDTLSG